MWLVLRHKRELKILDKKKIGLNIFFPKIKFTKLLIIRPKKSLITFFQIMSSSMIINLLLKYYKFYKKFKWIKNFTVKLLNLSKRREIYCTV